MKISRQLHHNECIAQLPEYLSGTLRRDEAATVAAHLEQCRRCREYLQLGQSLRRHFSRQQKILAALHDTEREQDNFDRLWQRIEADGGQNPAQPLAENAAVSIPAKRARRHRFPCAQTRRPWRSLANFASAVLAAVLAVQVAPPTPSPASLMTPHTSTTQTSCGHLRVHFIDNLQRADLQRLLGALDARVIEGPGRQGEYTLRAQRPNKTLYELQLHPAVVQAEAGGC